MSDDEFRLRVERLHQRHNDLVSVVPPTDDKAFAAARDRIQIGLHTPDKDQKGNVR